MSDTEYKIKLSPSRVNSVGDCSWQYYCSYVIKLPRFGNDGSKRGSVCHNLLELLPKKRHQHYIDKILKAGDPFLVPAINRLLLAFCKKEELPPEQTVVNKDKDGLTTHKKEIASMIIVALTNDFLGKPGDEIITEISHTVKINEGSKKFSILGIIDKVFVRRDEKGDVYEVEVVDYKTSSKKFDPEDMESNLQGLVYQYFVKDMYPNVKSVKFSFLFLRFPKSPKVDVPKFKEDMKDGFEHYLTYISKYMENFGEKEARSNFAKNSKSTSFLCGLYGKKKYMDKSTKQKVEHDEPQFLCAVRDPFTYYAVIDKDSNNIRSAISLEKLKPKEGEIVVSRQYLGCPAHHAYPSSIKRDWSILK